MEGSLILHKIKLQYLTYPLMDEGFFWRKKTLPKKGFLVNFNLGGCKLIF